MKYKLMKQFPFCLSTLLGTKTKLHFICNAEQWHYWNGIIINKKTTNDNSIHVTISTIVGCRKHCLFFLVEIVTHYKNNHY